jgi:hypothetical protein
MHLVVFRHLKLSITQVAIKRGLYLQVSQQQPFILLVPVVVVHGRLEPVVVVLVLPKALSVSPQEMFLK